MDRASTPAALDVEVKSLFLGRLAGATEKAT